MLKKVLAFILLLVPISIALAVVSSPKELLKKRCTPCHSLSLVHRTKKTQAEWKKTVDRMIGYGAQLNEEEREAVIEYLSEK